MSERLVMVVHQKPRLMTACILYYSREGTHVDRRKNRKIHVTKYWTPDIVFYRSHEVVQSLFARRPVLCVLLTHALSQTLFSTVRRSQEMDR